LLKAFDLEPTNVDVNVCLGIGYAKLKNYGRALHFYEKALDKSPKHRAALEGAAGAAAKSGSSGKAKRLYERLLAVDPSNADAKAYLDADEPETAGGESGAKPEGGADSGGPEAPAPPP
jgi:tetratricopeptide (TPR) repeat protein